MNVKKDEAAAMWPLLYECYHLYETGYSQIIPIYDVAISLYVQFALINCCYIVDVHTCL